jgi:hypothetical protein
MLEHSRRAALQGGYFRLTQQVALYSDTVIREIAEKADKAARDRELTLSEANQCGFADASVSALVKRTFEQVGDNTGCQKR